MYVLQMKNILFEWMPIFLWQLSFDFINWKNIKIYVWDWTRLWFQLVEKHPCFAKLLHFDNFEFTKVRDFTNSKDLTRNLLCLFFLVDSGAWSCGDDNLKNTRSAGEKERNDFVVKYRRDNLKRLVIECKKTSKNLIVKGHHEESKSKQLT